MPYTIQKLSYSSKPWRLMRDGQEVRNKGEYDHPSLGMIVIDEPFAADSKSEMVDKILAKLESLDAYIEGVKTQLGVKD